MVSGRLKSRTYRRIKTKTPKKTVTHYRKPKPKTAKCGICGAELKGIPRAKPNKLKNMAKTKKRPERRFGGVLCSRCSRKKIIQEARK